MGQEGACDTHTTAKPPCQKTMGQEGACLFIDSRSVRHCVSDQDAVVGVRATNIPENRGTSANAEAGEMIAKSRKIESRNAMRLRGLLCCVSVFLALVRYTSGSSHFNAVPCSDAIPRRACFGFGPPESFWNSGVKLPLAETLGYVRELLQKALEVEHATIPLYLTTQYSIVNQSSFEAKTIRSVVMEGMLRASRPSQTPLVINILFRDFELSQVAKS